MTPSSVRKSTRRAEGRYSQARAGLFEAAQPDNRADFSRALDEYDDAKSSRESLGISGMLNDHSNRLEGKMQELEGNILERVERLEDANNALIEGLGVKTDELKEIIRRMLKLSTEIQAILNE